MIIHSKSDICVLGLGRFGQAVVKQLAKMKRPAFALDMDERNVQEMALYAAQVAVVDGTNIDGLRGLGLRNFQTVIVAVADNIDIVATLSELGVKNIIAKSTSERHARVLKQIGVDVIVSPEHEAGVRTAILATNAAFIRYSKQIEEIGDGFGMASTTLKNSDWADKKLMELKFNSLLINVVSINRDSTVILPTGKIQLKIGDTLTIIGALPDLARAMSILSQEGKEISPL